MLSITHTTKKSPNVSEELFLSIKNTVLGKKYDLSVHFIGEVRAKKLNETYRNKSYTPNILSFPISDDVGEIYICVPIAKRTAQQEKHPLKKQLLFLFIHGCLHLSGLAHGKKMESLEDKLFEKFCVQL